ncbi:MAG: PDZ domain-containing protein [Halarcobacter ebronensis]
MEKIIKDSPAQRAGLQTEDKIVRINDTDIKTWKQIGETITPTKAALKFYVKRDGELISKVINPEINDSENIFREKIKKRMIGISPAPKLVTIYHSPY